MFSKEFLSYMLLLSILFSGVIYPLSSHAMGGKPEKVSSTNEIIASAPVSNVTLKELADIYWPDSNATELQQEETLKNLLGKKVNWKITVVQIQRDGEGYLVQGQSDKDMLGTFSYIRPSSEAEKEALINAQMGSTLDITGIVSDMQMRHMVLKPAVVNLNK